MQLADVACPGTWGLGALTDLAGEVTVCDGEVWICVGDAEHPATSHGAPGDVSAAVLFVADVPARTEAAVTETVDSSVFDAWLDGQVRAAGLDPTAPFPFVVEGGLRHLQLHVLAGACPMRARLLGRAQAARALRPRPIPWPPGGAAGRRASPATPP